MLLGLSWSYFMRNSGWAEMGRKYKKWLLHSAFLLLGYAFNFSFCTGPRFHFDTAIFISFSWILDRGEKHTLSYQLSLKRNENANHPIPKRTISCAEGKNGENNRSEPVNFFFKFYCFCSFSPIADSPQLQLEILHFIHTDEIFMAIFLCGIGFYSC